MDDFENNDRLTTADIANPGAAAEERNRIDDSIADRIDSDETRTADERTGTDRMGSDEPRLTTRQVVDQANSGQSTSAGSADAQHMALFPDDELRNYRARWDKVQTSFVDEPRKAVEDADSLVANVVKRLAEQFAAERATLEKQWDKGGDVSTEDLRQGLRRYRAFFDRLLSV